jgi:hypothetical protein
VIIREISSSLPIKKDFGIKNLIISGCSFSYNNDTKKSTNWPGFLAERFNIPRVIDNSLPGAGNYHINTSMQWCLESGKYSSQDSLVIVMWSGNDRDDFIIDSSNILKEYGHNYKFNNNVSTAISGGMFEHAVSNTIKPFRENIINLKSAESRAVENYLYVSSLYNYLSNCKYRFVFLNYLDHSVPSRTRDMDIKKYLSNDLKKRYESWFAPVDNIYAWCLKRDLLSPDDFHPTHRGALSWTDNCLIPYLESILC